MQWVFSRNLLFQSKYSAFMTLHKGERELGDTLPSFTLWHKLQAVPLLLALRESQPLNLIMRLT